MTGSDWANYETWLVHVHMFNEESVRKEFRSALEKRAKEGLDRRTVRDIVTHDVQAFVEETAEEASRRVRNPMIADFIGSFPGRIDCSQIADSWMEVYDGIAAEQVTSRSPSKGTARNTPTRKGQRSRAQRSRRSRGGVSEWFTTEDRKER